MSFHSHRTLSRRFPASSTGTPKINDLTDVRVFVHVAATGSLSSAARELDLSLASVSKRLSALERQLGLVLVRRTTRSQSLTPEGSAFLEHCKRILAEVDRAETLAAVSQRTVNGLLTLSSPRAFGVRHVIPLVIEFRKRYPELDIRLLFNDERFDTIEEGVDLSFRFGAPPDSTFFARQIAPNHQIICSSPSYVRQHGSPMSPADLQGHTCIVHGTRRSSWPLRRRKQTFNVDLSPKYIVNDTEAAQELAQAGVGICLGSIWNVTPELETGKLIKLLREFTIPDEPLYVVYPHGRQLAPRVRHFLDFAMIRLRVVWRQVSANNERILAVESEGRKHAARSVVSLALGDSMPDPGREIWQQPA